MQKTLKTLGLVLLAFTLSVGVGISVHTETASAAKKVNAKKLKLKKKKLSLKVGEKKTLKVTVKPKNATLKWKSNKKKIATVSKKGVVKGKKKGTAKITVTSGKKKATCKVTVKQTYNIKAVEVINSKVIRVTLNKAKKLTANDFAVIKKRSSEAKNTQKLTVASVSNSKNKVYTLVLATNYDLETDDNYVADNDYVSVTIKKLNGLKTKETIYYSSAIPRNVYIGGKTGDIINEDVAFNSSYRGYLSGVKVSGLPAGLRAEVHNQFVTIKGIPTAVANGTTVTMTAKDELGKSLTQKVLFYIGSDTQIVSYIPTEGRTILANNNSSESFVIHAFGGSGRYKYSLVNNTNKYIAIDEDDNDIYFYGYRNNEANKREYLPAGRYSVSYAIADRDNAAITAGGSLDVTAVNGVKITGTVVAGDNSAVSNANVNAWFKDVNHTFYSNSLNAYTESGDSTNPDNPSVKLPKGSYELVVYPSQAYSLEASAGGAVSGVENYNPGTANQVRNFALPIYKVSFASTAIDVTKYGFDIEGVDGDGRKPYGSAEAYLKKGSYRVDETETVTTTTGFTTTTSTYKITAQFTVAGNMTVNLTAAKVGTDQVTSQISTTVLKVAESDEDFAYVFEDSYYKFVPAEDGKFVLNSEYAQSVRMYTIDGKLVNTYTAKELGDHQYQVTTDNLTKDTEYVFQFSNDDRITVKKQLPAPAA